MDGGSTFDTLMEISFSESDGFNVCIAASRTWHILPPTKSGTFQRSDCFGDLKGDGVPLLLSNLSLSLSFSGTLSFYVYFCFVPVLEQKNENEKFDKCYSREGSFLYPRERHISVRVVSM